jgi:peptidase M28-like protein
VLDPRIYRAAFLPILFALVLVGFSLRDQPSALTTTLAPDAFDGGAAFGDLQQLAADAPLRRPGSAGDRLVADRVAASLRGDGFRVRVRQVSGRTADGTRALETVTAERAGFSNRRIVVIAHRDALGRGARAELSGTAALLELGRVLGGRTLNRTLVLVSTSGGSAGAAGAARFAADPGGPVDAVIALGDLAGTRTDRPLVVPWSDTSAVAPLVLRRTVEAAVMAEARLRPGGVRPAVQLARAAFPLALGGQAPFAGHGLPAVLLSASGERPPAAGAPVSAARLTAFGRAALRSVSALDGGADVPAPAPAILLARKLLPAGPIRLLVAALLLPVLVAGVDALARVRRRREQVGMWLRWVLISAVPFALTALFVVLLEAIGLLTATPAAMLPAGAVPVGGAALVSALVVFALGWLALRPPLLRLAGVRGKVGGPGAATAVVLVLWAAAFVVWLGNAYAALLLVPALHLWLLALAPDLPLRRPVALLLFAIGVLPPLLVAYAYARQLGLDPFELAWAGLLLVASGAISLPAALVWSVVLGCTATALAVLLRGGAAAPAVETPITVRGPATYAGPGSLGGTESALRR